MLTLIPVPRQPTCNYDENGWFHMWQSAKDHDLGIEFDSPYDYVECLRQCFTHRFATVRRWHQWQQRLKDGHEEKVLGYTTFQWISRI